MNYKVNMELNLNSNDILKEEIQKAVRAYAKNIARESIQNEVKTEMDMLTEKWVKRLFTKNYTAPISEALVRDAATELIKEYAIKSGMPSYVSEAVHNAIEVQKGKITSFIEQEVDSFLKTDFATQLIQEEIKEAVPGAVLELLKEKEIEQ